MPEKLKKFLSLKIKSSVVEFQKNIYLSGKGLPYVNGEGPNRGSIVGVKATLADGSYHDVDSSDMAFQLCARTGFREAFLKTKPVLLEPTETQLKFLLT